MHNFSSEMTRLAGEICKDREDRSDFRKRLRDDVATLLKDFRTGDEARERFCSDHAQHTDEMLAAFRSEQERRSQESRRQRQDFTRSLHERVTEDLAENRADRIGAHNAWMSLSEHGPARAKVRK